MVLVFFTGNDYFGDVKFSFRILLVKSGGDFFFGFGFSYERDFRNKNVGKVGHDRRAGG